MHQKLATVAEELWGVDIDASGIAFLQSVGFDHVFVGDVCELGQIAALEGQKFDTIVASEVIEHVLNPGALLRSARGLMIAGESELIVTVPNAFRIDTLIALFRGVEHVHPDHNYWFSYQTVTNLVRKSGYEISGLYVYSFQPCTILPARRIHSTSSPRGSPPLPNNTGRSLLQRRTRVFSYMKSLPRRILVAYLYKITPFWGDGLIVLARIN